VPYKDLATSFDRSGRAEGLDGDPDRWIAWRVDRHRNAGEPFEYTSSDGRCFRVTERRTGEGGIVSIFAEITDLKAKEAALRASEERYALAMEGANEGMWDWDAGTSEIHVSDRFKALVGLRPDVATITPAEWEALVHPEDVARHREAVLAHLRGDVPCFVSEYRVRLPDGDCRWIFNRGLGVRDASGRVTRMAGSLGDVTARKETEIALLRAKQEADEANRAKSTFLANMSHELRTPLNAIIGYSEMLIELADEVEKGDFAPDLDKIRTAGKHLLGLINDILDLSKIEAGKMDLFVEEFDVAAVLKDVRATVEPLVARNGNALEVRHAPDLGAMRSDQVKVRQTLFNLLGNAAKFTKEGRITLEARRLAGGDGDRLEFRSPTPGSA
jgi:PAS domain S-box-containing protein